MKNIPMYWIAFLSFFSLVELDFKWIYWTLSVSDSDDVNQKNIDKRETSLRGKKYRRTKKKRKEEEEEEEKETHLRFNTLRKK